MFTPRVLMSLVIGAALSVNFPVYSTTIAADSTTIAADEQLTKDHAKHMGAQKIHYYPERKCYVAGVGEFAKIIAFMEWFKDQKADVVIKGEYEILAYYEDGKIFLYQDINTDRVPMTAPMALGSGQNFAMGAMMNGATAAEAVAIAEKCDIYTGGKILVFTVCKPADNKK